MTVSIRSSQKSLVPTHSVSSLRSSSLSSDSFHSTYSSHPMPSLPLVKDLLKLLSSNHYVLIPIELLLNASKINLSCSCNIPIPPHFFAETLSTLVLVKRNIFTKKGPFAAIAFSGKENVGCYDHNSLVEAAECLSFRQTYNAQETPFLIWAYQLMTSKNAPHYSFDDLDLKS